MVHQCSTASPAQICVRADLSSHSALRRTQSCVEFERIVMDDGSRILRLREIKLLQTQTDVNSYPRALDFLCAFSRIDRATTVKVAYGQMDSAISPLI